MNTTLQPTIRRFALFVLMMTFPACNREKPVSLGGPTMGTTWSLQAAGGKEETRRMIQTHLDQREAVFSHWKADSPLSQFNDSQSTDWFPVPEELVAVAKATHDMSLETAGALDVTVGGAVEALGFGMLGGDGLKPGLQNRIGWGHLKWREAPPALKKDDPGLRIHVAAVVEGFVMNELVSRLKEEGLTDFLLEVGGEVVAVGHAPGGGPWQVGIQAPDGAPGETLEHIPLKDACIATSGSYRHRHEKEGRTYSHIVDPRTGRPVEHKLVSVSVIHPSCLLADGYATALMVLGPEEGRKAAARLGLRVIWLEEP
ncbi:FAD:protein FMN transferase [Prosthecobacter sp. SYSU 5D2]|uniref:FAD:protein FMN transferase n=1 Tax=Prosthecobacter sp. SYSU 5D2 TaxID=3134134 RepID=UPI0031FED145